jgi:hypothetical protein
MAFTDSAGTQWPDTVQKDGMTYYLDPVASSSGGRPYYRPDPKQRQKWEEERGFREKTETPPSPWEGLAMGAAATGLGVTASSLGGSAAKAVAGQTAQEVLKEKLAEEALAKLEASRQGLAQAATQSTVTPAVQTAAAQTTTVPAGAAIPEGMTVVGPAADGGSIVAPTASVAEAGTSVAGQAALAAPYLAVAYGAKAVYDFASGKKLDTAQKLAMALPTAGLSLVSDKLQSAFGLGPSLKEKRADEAAGLVGKGITGYDEYYANSLKPGMDGTLQSSMPVNTEFETSRDEKFLRPEDVWGAPTNFSVDPNWLGYSEDQRRQIAQQALSKGLYRESGGGIDITDPLGFQGIVKQVVSGEQSAAPAVQPLAPINQSALNLNQNLNAPSRTRVAQENLAMTGVLPPGPVQTLPTVQKVNTPIQLPNSQGFVFLAGKDPRQQLAMVGAA